MLSFIYVLYIYLIIWIFQESAMAKEGTTVAAMIWRAALVVLGTLLFAANMVITGLDTNPSTNSKCSTPKTLTYLYWVIYPNVKYYEEPCNLRTFTVGSIEAAMLKIEELGGHDVAMYVYLTVLFTMQRVFCA